MDVIWLLAQVKPFVNMNKCVQRMNAKERDCATTEKKGGWDAAGSWQGPVSRLMVSDRCIDLCNHKQMSWKWCRKQINPYTTSSFDWSSWIMDGEPLQIYRNSSIPTNRSCSALGLIRLAHQGSTWMFLSLARSGKWVRNLLAQSQFLLAPVQIILFNVKGPSQSRGDVLMCLVLSV